MQVSSGKLELPTKDNVALRKGKRRNPCEKTTKMCKVREFFGVVTALSSGPVVELFADV